MLKICIYLDKPEFIGENKPLLYDKDEFRSYKVRFRANPPPKLETITLRYGGIGEEITIHPNDVEGDNILRLTIRPVAVSICTPK